ncbi:hypothetical protein ACLOJK_025000 [Asimina triloba]
MKSISFLGYLKIHQLSIQTLQTQSHQYSFLNCYCGASPPSSLLQYLRASFGFSHERALQISQRLKHKTPRNPDSVISFFKSHGFSQPHIKSIITKTPQLLFCDPETTLGPKISFFREKGLSETDVVGLVVSNPCLLHTSIEKCMKPTLSIIHSLAGMEKFQIKLLKHSMRLNPEKLAANVTVFKNCDVPARFITNLLLKQSRALGMDPDRFSEAVKTVKKMGFNPSSHRFVEAVSAILNLSHSVWDKKFEVYRSFSWSNGEILGAFHNHPWCICLSGEKIKRGLNFFMKELGWSSSYIVSCACILSMSLEKRIMPRYRLFKVLVLKGLIDKDRKITASIFRISEQQFMSKYVMKYKTDLPEILKIYEGSGRLKGQNAEDGEESMVQ